MMIKGSVLGASVAALLVAYGCERQNPGKLGGDLNTGEHCIEPPEASGPSGPTTTTGPTTTSAGPGSGGSTSGTTGSGGAPATTSGGTGNTMEAPKTELDDRVLDYSEALRIASLKVVGTLPTNTQIYELADTAEKDKPAKYVEMIDKLLADPRFGQRMIEYHREVFKMFGVPVDNPNTPENEALLPSRETAPMLAAQIVVEGKPWTDLLTQKSDACPTFDAATGKFTPAKCANAASVMAYTGQEAVGMLTDPGALSLYYGNLAMRRNRFFHETFLCLSGNAAGFPEGATKPYSTIGACGEPAPSNYSSPWPMNRISGACNTLSPPDFPESKGRIDFHAWNSSVVCANCHGTWNHRAPLWAPFDDKGMVDVQTETFMGKQVPNFPVLVPVEGAPRARMADWLPDGEPLAWKYTTDGSMNVKDLIELGNVMAKDDAVIKCAVKRTWNYAMSRGDIVENAGADVPDDAKFFEALVKSFETNGYNMKTLLRAILLHDDFVRF
jgi:hypothetical protein